ncbi:UNVERIFIED_ORG: putative transcriptional regulator [Arthrobacter sp. UYEF1]
MRRPYHVSIDRARLQVLVSEGKSLNEIAAELDVTQRTISRHKRALGLSAPKPPCKPVEEWRTEADRLLEEGYSQVAVAEVLGVGSSTVSKYFPGRGWTDQQKGAYAIEVRRLNQLTNLLHPKHRERTTNDHHSTGHNGNHHHTSPGARRSGSDCHE